MRQFTLNLDREMQRPIVSLSNLQGLTALLDTGAYFPIWTDEEDILSSLLGAKLIKKDVPFGGFGGQTKGNLYKFTMTFGDLIYPDMNIIACGDLQVPFNMILSATMFNKLIYEIDDRNHKLNVTIPEGESLVRNLIIRDSGGKLHVLCTGTMG